MNNNNNNNNQAIQALELKINIIFNVLSILTHGFVSDISFTWGTLKIRINVYREASYLYGIEGDTVTRSDEELFINAISTWRFHNLRVIISVYNLTVDRLYHNTPNTFPPRSMRYTYINIHPPGLFLNRCQSVKFSLLYLITSAFTIGNTSFYVGPYTLNMAVTNRPVRLPALTHSYIFDNREATLMSLQAVFDMMDYTVN